MVAYYPRGLLMFLQKIQTPLTMYFDDDVELENLDNVGLFSEDWAWWLSFAAFDLSSKT